LISCTLEPQRDGLAGGFRYADADMPPRRQRRRWRDIDRLLTNGMSLKRKSAVCARHSFMFLF
jgi:hypothetical protein